MKIRLLACGFVLGAAAALVTSQAVSQDGGVHDIPSPEEMQQAMADWMASMTPGKYHRLLDAQIGTWEAETKMWMDPAAPPVVTRGTSTRRWVLDGRFVMDEFSSMMMMPNPENPMQMQEVPWKGMGLTGYDNNRNLYVGCWMDSMGTQMLTMKGGVDPSGTVFTSYGEMDEPMLGVVGRTVKYQTKVVDDDHHVFTIYDLHAGDDYKVIEIHYTPRELIDRPRAGRRAGPRVFVMELTPDDLTPRERSRLLIGGVVPRPIAFVSTVDGAGGLNLAPFSFFTAVGVDPMTLLFCPGSTGDGADKDTLHNARPPAEGGTGEFVVNVATEAYRRQMAATAEALGPGESEFALAGLAEAPSAVVRPPRVAESPVAFECVTTHVIRTNPGAPGAGNIVIGRVVHVFVDDRLADERLRIDADALAAIGRMGGLDYCTTRDRFELPAGRAAIEPTSPS